MRARTWGTPSTAWWAISWRQIHSRRSSAGRLHSSPNASRLGTRMSSSSEGRRGIGRSYWPNDRRARWPTIDPAVMATIIGCMACSIGPSMAVNWSSAPRPRSGSSPVAPAAASVAPSDAGQLLEQGPVVLERALRPRARG